MADALKPCRSPYCECTEGQCTHPGCYDARGEQPEAVQVPQGRQTPLRDCATDCRSDTGITVGLVDALISVARVLAKRRLASPEVAEALADLRGDEDVARVLAANTATAAPQPPAQTEARGDELTGAVLNGLLLMDRLETGYNFECEAVPLRLCSDWVELLRCFRHLASYVSRPIQSAPQAGEASQPMSREVMSQAARNVLAERQRQIEAEGWTPEHDDAHHDGTLAQAAGCYATWAFEGEQLPNWVPTGWPWADSWWKPSTPRLNLIRAGALILAELERLDRASAHGIGSGSGSGKGGA